MFDFLLASFLVYQYWLLFGVCILASFGIPLPATALLLVGGAFLAQGYFDVISLFFSGFIGCVMGDMLGYILSSIFGKDLFIRMGFGRFIDIERLISQYGSGFIKRSGVTVFLSRWLITTLGPSVNIIAGLSKMNHGYFLFMDITGEILYVALYVSIGYSFGSQWEEILLVIESFSTMILSLVLLASGFYFFWRHSHVIK